MAGEICRVCKEIWLLSIDIPSLQPQPTRRKASNGRNMVDLRALRENLEVYH